MQIKVAVWIGGLMSWAVVIDADQYMPANMPHDALQCHPHLQKGFHNLQQAKLSDDNNLGAFGHRRLLEYMDFAKTSSGLTNTSRTPSRFVNADIAKNVGSRVSSTRAMIPKPPQRITKSATLADEAVSDLGLLFKNAQLIGTGAFDDISKADSGPWVRKSIRASNFESFRNETTVLII